MKNLVLIGMPGSGKTKLARLLAERFGLTHVDTDDLIVQAAGMTIPQIFARYGEPYFRDLETQAVRQAAGLDRVVIATGGGAVLRPENVAALKETGILFFRDRDPQAIAGENHGGRPLIGDDRDKVFRLYRERLPLYKAAADCYIPHTDTIAEAAELIARRYEEADL